MDCWKAPSKHSSSEKPLSTLHSQLLRPSLPASPPSVLESCISLCSILHHFWKETLSYYFHAFGQGSPHNQVILFHAALLRFYVSLKPSVISWPYSIHVGGEKNHCILKCWLHQMATRLEDSNHAGLRRLKTRLENWSLLSLYRKKWIKKENNKEGCALILLCSR